MKVGKPSTFNSLQMDVCSPPSIFTSINREPCKLTNESITGAIFLHGGHHTVLKSTSTVLSFGINARYSCMVICFTATACSTGLSAFFQALMPPAKLKAVKPFCLSHCVAALLLAPLRQ